MSQQRIERRGRAGRRGPRSMARMEGRCATPAPARRATPATALAAILILVLVAALLSACGDTQTSGSAQTGDEPQPGGTYNFPLSSNPVYLDPLNGNYESEGTQVQHQVFEGLMQYVLQDDGSMKATPKIAESFTVNDDATVFTFKIRKGVMFQSPVSREVTAQDVVDSWNRVTDPENESLTSYILAPIKGCGEDGYQSDPKAGLTGVKALDDSTVEVTLRYPFAEFPQTLGHAVVAITPVDYIDKVGAKAFNQKPVGTGPYMLEEWKGNRYVDLIKNPDYWDEDNAGYVDTVHMPIINDTSTQWLEFQKGNLDFTSVPPGQVKAAENNAKVKSGEWSATKWPSLSTYFIGFNLADKVVGYPAGDKGLMLRQALTYSADRTPLINIVNEGVPIEATSIVPVGVPGYTADQDPYVYDPDKAKELIADYGTVPTLQYWYNTDLVHQKNAEALQAGWEAVGVKMELSNFDFGTLLDKLSHGDEGAGDQVFRSGWVADYPSMDNFLYGLFNSESSGSTSNTFYANDKVDEMLVEARGTVDDKARQELYAEIERIILKDAAVIPIYYYRDFRVTNNRVQGQVLDPMYFVDMWKVWVAK